MTRVLEAVADFIAKRYASAGAMVEVGIGAHLDVALDVQARLAGARLRATDMDTDHVSAARLAGLDAVRDDVFSPNLAHYEAAELVYAVRPAPEMLPALAELGRRLRADILVFPLSEDAPTTAPAGWRPLLVDSRRIGYGLSALLAEPPIEAPMLTATSPTP